MSDNKYIKSISIISSIISVLLGVLYAILVPFDEEKLSIFDNLSSTELMLTILCIVSIIISIIASVLSMIILYRKYHKQQKMVEILLQYNRLSNKGEAIYNKQLEELFKDETITKLELEKLRKIHIVLNESKIDSSEESIGKDIDGLYRVFDKISAEAKNDAS